MMKKSAPTHTLPICAARQRGVVLFFALVALVALSLSAVALIRSVDTSTLIAGNLAFKQSATRTSDQVVDSAIQAAYAQQIASSALSLLNDPTHSFNVTCLALRPAGTLSATDPGCAAIVPGYHSNFDSTLDLKASTTWNDINSVLVSDDGNGNTTRYLIQRMCKNANQPLITAQCLTSGNQVQLNPQGMKDYQNACTVQADCDPAAVSPVVRITTRVTGPKSTVSYVQVFAL